MLFAGTHLEVLTYAACRVAQPSDTADVVANAFLVTCRRIHEAPTGAEVTIAARCRAIGRPDRLPLLA
ncbi:hypothetical protein [Terrabacter sp. C0L_2]|uniref:hypothetical protein n=1 Tax=Terrabacter sp. C0L_2 TaxID=3108389 RepID=UPI002ED549F0|nr:hypothetical protein U5C87_17190 [Terrabacter sp. C0L_2]